jgi:hypothetical protein
LDVTFVKVIDPKLRATCRVGVAYQITHLTPNFSANLKLDFDLKALPTLNHRWPTLVSAMINLDAVVTHDTSHPRKVERGVVRRHKLATRTHNGHFLIMINTMILIKSN